MPGEDILTRTIQAIPRIPSIALTVKGTFGVSTAGIVMTWV